MQEQEKRATQENDKTKRPYEPPKIVTYSGEDLLEELGPAQACTGFSCPIAPGP